MNSAACQFRPSAPASRGTRLAWRRTKSIQNVLSTSPRAETSSLPPAPKKNTVLQPLRAGKTQKAIFITSRTLTQAGLVQQTVQIVARFAHTI